MKNKNNNYHLKHLSLDLEPPEIYSMYMYQMRYTKWDLERDFPTNEACLQWILEWLYPDGVFCKRCQKVQIHYKDTGLPSYTCKECRAHVSPMAGTIFHKSTTPLTKWFYAIYLMSATRAGISAKQLERELGVTYKCAWRMFHQIRKLMASDDVLEGEVEVDETYIHPDASKSSRIRREPGRQYYNSQVIFGMVERNGKAKVRHVQSAGVRVLVPAIKESVKPGTTVYSDGWRAYEKLPIHGYPHAAVVHSKGQYVAGVVHTQNIENLWSNMKRGITGVYRHVDPKYLQAYADEYAFRYSHRNDFQPMFWALLCRVTSARPGAASS